MFPPWNERSIFGENKRKKVKRDNFGNVNSIRKKSFVIVDFIIVLEYFLRKM